MKALINNISARLKTITPKVYLVVPQGAIMPYIEFSVETVGDSADEEFKELIVDIHDDSPLSMATIFDWEEQVAALFKRVDVYTEDFSYSSYKESEETIKDKENGINRRVLTYRLDTYLKEV